MSIVLESSCRVLSLSIFLDKGHIACEMCKVLPHISISNVTVCTDLMFSFLIKAYITICLAIVFKNNVCIKTFSECRFCEVMRLRTKKFKKKHPFNTGNCEQNYHDGYITCPHLFHLLVD